MRTNPQTHPSDNPQNHHSDPLHRTTPSELRFRSHPSETRPQNHPSATTTTMMMIMMMMKASADHDDDAHGHAEGDGESASLLWPTYLFCRSLGLPCHLFGSTQTATSPCTSAGVKVSPTQVRVQRSVIKSSRLHSTSCWQGRQWAQDEMGTVGSEGAVLGFLAQ